MHQMIHSFPEVHIRASIPNLGGYLPELFSHACPEPNVANHALCGFSVRRTPRACHGACDHLRPGRLRASHAVCLASRTLAPAICARKEETDNESVSTIERIRIQLFAMRSLNRSFKTDSLHASSASSTDFSDSLPHLLRSEKTPNNGAAENCSGRARVSRWLLPAEPAAQPARHRPPQSLSLSR